MRYSGNNALQYMVHVTPLGYFAEQKITFLVFFINHLFTCISVVVFTRKIGNSMTYCLF